LKNVTGIYSPYEAPTDLEITVNTVELSVEETADAVLSFLESREQVGFWTCLTPRLGIGNLLLLCLGRGRC